jgi:ribosomal protein S5
MAHPARAAAPAAAKGLENLLAVVVERTQEYPSRETVEADALRVVVIIPASGSGVVEGGAFHNICTMYAIHKHKLL